MDCDIYGIQYKTNTTEQTGQPWNLFLSVCEERFFFLNALYNKCEHHKDILRMFRVFILWDLQVGPDIHCAANKNKL